MHRLYRSYLRAVRRLPHLYLRQFFAIRARDDVDAAAGFAEPARRERKMKDVARRVRLLERANSRDVKAFQRILALAYGRAGRLRWELLEPILTDPSVPKPKPIIPSLPRSAPPVYPPELTRLLTTPTLKHKKALSHAELATPRFMPERADPTSADAQLFGPFSKRREANIRNRAYALWLKRIQPPLEVAVRTDQGESSSSLPALDAVRTDVYPRPLAMQHLGVLQDINDLIGNAISIPMPSPRRARTESTPPPDTMHPSRWVRRRYRTLLASIPQLTYSVSETPKGTRTSFDIDSPPLSITPNHRSTHYSPLADAASLAWVSLKSPQTPAPNSNQTKERKEPKAAKDDSARVDYSSASKKTE